MNNILNISIRQFLICLVAAAYVLWGTSWEIPILGLPISYIWIVLILTGALLLPETPLDKKDVIPLLLYLALIVLMSIVSLPVLLSSNSYYGDINYLLEYDLKILIGCLTIFVFNKMIKSENDIRLLSFILCVVAAPLIFLLFWKYIYVFQTDYMGVIFSRPEKMGKNSLAMAIALIAPFFFINFSQGTVYKIASVLGVIALVIATININSRAMVIVCIFELLVFLYFSGRKKILLLTFFLGFILSVYSGLSVQEFLVKRSGSQEVITMQRVVEILGSSHRGRLTKYAITGFIDSNGLGNGIATYKVKQAGIVGREDSRTESHNDLLLILFEQGIFGIILMSYLIGRRIKLTIRIVKVTGNSLGLASLVSMFALIVSMFFANFISSLVFWMILALNIVVVNAIKKNTNMKANLYQ